MKSLKPVMISGKEILPLIEGGKGISVTKGASSGAWAAAGGAGTFSGVCPDFHDDEGNLVGYFDPKKTRKGRHEELIEKSILGGINQAQIAHEVSGGNGRIHMNVLWEMGGADRILEGVLDGAKGLVHGVTCGAGMPYRLSEIASARGVYYYPIVSSARAFNALWKRSYRKFPEFLGGVVYEDPWKAGGHNGLSNNENMDIPQDPYPRVVELRSKMDGFGLQHVPIVMAGGVWCLKDFEAWIGDPAVGLLAFQLGTRPLLTKESPISENWKKKLPELKKGDVFINWFSPTGFPSSAVKNDFMTELEARSARQVPYTRTPEGELTESVPVGTRGRLIYLKAADKPLVEKWIADGYTEGLRTPVETMVFVTPQRAQSITQDQADCIGCLSACGFSNWTQYNEEHTTGKIADARSFCIQKSLREISHSDEIDDALMFAGHNVYRFGEDPFYKNGFVPTVKELVDRIMTGE
ncbi:MAG: NAD(P)H-dependent flavin oxidoreductase [Alphaproteobacteria bacterium]